MAHFDKFSESESIQRPRQIDIMVMEEVTEEYMMMMMMMMINALKDGEV